MDENPLKFDWLKQKYFSDESKVLSFKAGDLVFEQDAPNYRLYLITKGSVTGWYQHQADDDFFEVFTNGVGHFIGVQSFFSKTYSSYCRVVADEDLTLAYIDRMTQAIEPEYYGSFEQQFMPLVVSRLNNRTLRSTRAGVEKQRALQQLNQAEKLSTLGQLAAGLAHELNNALGVLNRKSDYLAQFLEEALHTRFEKEYAFFKSGLNSGQVESSSELRERIRAFQKQLGLSKQSAKMLARIAPSVDDGLILGKRSLDKLELYSQFWEAGRDFHDLRLAANHGANIVNSVKQLAAQQQDRHDDLQVNDTLHQALQLLQSQLRGINLELKLGVLSPIFANESELTQVWINLIKNACDAMKNENNASKEAQLTIETRQNRTAIIIKISDNGPGVPKALQEKIFQPDFTTKKGGLSFGLGLGLSISGRIIESYQGHIQLQSQKNHTCFTVALPLAIPSNLPQGK